MNAGLRALKKESPEAYEKITGKKAMYGMKTPMAMAEYGKKIMMGMGGMNSLSEKEKQQYAAMGMKAMKEYGMGGKMYEDGGKMYENGGQNSEAMYGTKTPMAEYGKKNMMGMGGMNMYADDGKKMPKELVEYFERKKAEYGMKVMGDGGVYADEGDKNDPPELTAKQLLDIIAMQNPGQEVTGSSSDVARSIADNMGYTTAVSSTAAPIKAIYMDRGSVEEDPQPTPVRPTDLSPMKPMKASLSSQSPKKEIMDSKAPMPDQYEESFTGYVLAPYLRTGQVPTNIKVRNPQTGQFQDRQMEPEEIANYIYQNQVRQRVPSRMMSRDDAMEKALKIMRFRS
tara:strand:- start:35225 stop:36247 length:1023 start_codon:yes stop_codon:yes gene_type:complete